MLAGVSVVNDQRSARDSVSWVTNGGFALGLPWDWCGRFLGIVLRIFLVVFLRDVLWGALSKFLTLGLGVVLISYDFFLHLVQPLSQTTLWTKAYINATCGHLTHRNGPHSQVFVWLTLLRVIISHHLASSAIISQGCKVENQGKGYSSQRGKETTATMRLKLLRTLGVQ